MRAPALLLLILVALLPPAGAADPSQRCPSEMNKVKDLLEVNCTGQALSAVPSDLPADTGILLLSANRLESLSTATFVPLTQLQDLDLADNGLVALSTGPPLPSLRELILSRNALGALPSLQGLPALTRLAVAHNSLETLAPRAFCAVQQLQDLDLRGNRLRTLPPEAFKGLRALKDLDLSDNLLDELPKELLQDLQKLETLWLSGNRLQTLPHGFFPPGHLFAYVFLTENPWHCDCSLRYLKYWIQENHDSVYQPERGLEKTKVEVAPEKVLCQSPPEHQQKPVIHFKPTNCASVGDADEENEDDEYYDEEETVEKVTMPPLATTRPLLSTTQAPSTSPAVPASTRAPSPTTPVPAHPTATAAQTPGTTTALVAAPSSTPRRSTALVTAPSSTPRRSTALVAAPSSTPHRSTALITAPSSAPRRSTALVTAPSSTPHRSTALITAPSSAPRRPTALVPTTSLPTTASTRPPGTSSRPQTTPGASATNGYTTLVVSTSAFPTTPTAVPSTAELKASSIAGSSPPPLTSATSMVSTAMISSHVPTPPAPLDTASFTQPAPSPPPAPLQRCPCTTPAVPVLCSRAGAESPQWGRWVLRYCCLLHWVLYLASLVLLVLTVLAAAGGLLWMCLVGRPSWHQSLRSLRSAPCPLLGRRESTGSAAVHLSSFRSPLQRHTFCTIKEVELRPEVTYCTIKDLGTQRGPPARSPFRTTKELWVHRSPGASFQPFSRKLMATEPSSLRSPSAYSLDRGAEAIGAVRVKYASSTL